MTNKPTTEDDDVANALRRANRATGFFPAGWPPLEPTPAMLAAARNWSYAKYGKPIGDDAARGCWLAMLEAVTNGK